MTEYIGTSQILDANGVPFAQPNRIFDPFEPEGVYGFSVSGGVVQEERDKSLSTTLQRGIEFRKMLDDNPVIAGVYLTFMFLMGQVVWRFEPPEGLENDFEAQYYAAFFNSCIEDMGEEDGGGDFKEALRSLFEAFWFGYSVNEMIFKKRHGDHPDARFRSLYTDHLWGFRQFAPRKPGTIERWIFDRFYNVIGCVQQTETMGTYVIPADRFFMVRFRSTTGNPEGNGFLRSAYRMHWNGQQIEDYQLDGLRMNLAGFPVGTVPAEALTTGSTTQQRQVAKYMSKLLKGIQARKVGAALVPAETDREGKPSGISLAFQTTGGNMDDSSKALERTDKLTAMALMANILMIGMQQQGSWALHSSATSLTTLALNDMLKYIVTALRRPVRVVGRWNGFTQSKLPIATFSDIEPEGAWSLLKEVATAASGPLLTWSGEDEAWLRKKMGAPMRTPEVTTGAAADPGHAADPTGEPEPAQSVEKDGRKGMIDAARVAKVLDVSRNVVIGLIARGTLRGSKVGGRWKVTVDSYEEYLRGLTAGPIEPETA